MTADGPVSVLFLLLLSLLLLLSTEATQRATLRGTGQDDASYKHNDTITLASRIGRRLSATYDLITKEYIRTYNGQVPRVSCQLGYYRPPGGSNLVMVTGQRLDGCVPCPRGTYGSVTGLTDRSCSGSCPSGTYSEMVGRTSVGDCQRCPRGRYGTSTGLTTALCTAACPAGKYTLLDGNTALTSCQVCPKANEMPPCSWPILPRHNERTGALATWP